MLKKDTENNNKPTQKDDLDSTRKASEKSEKPRNPWDLAKKAKSHTSSKSKLAATGSKRTVVKKARRSDSKPDGAGTPDEREKKPYRKSAGDSKGGFKSKRSAGKSPWQSQEKTSYKKEEEGGGTKGSGHKSSRRGSKTVWPSGGKSSETSSRKFNSEKTAGKKPYASKTAAEKTNRAKPTATRKPASAASQQPSPRAAEGMRLNRYIALAGICARRKADELIAEGRVKLNGEVVTQMGIRVSASDVVEVGGNRITPLDHEYILLNKPSNFITTNSDEKDRKIVLDLIEDQKIKDSGVFPVGRLDRNTVGILLLTNDGELAHRLMHPRFQIDKLYHVITESPVLSHQLAELKSGVEVDGEALNLDDVQYINLPKKNELGIRLHEGKNRHIRRMLAAVGHESISLERVQYAGLSTEGVRRGKWRRLTKIEIKRLRRLVKLK